ncbi:MAG: hypothetical protein ABI668_11200 [Sphingorhabdus sp.]
MLIFALALATPSSFTEIHQRDIACVATLGLEAQRQQLTGVGQSGLPDVRETGRRWAGLVGARIVAETGQPRELVAFAIQQAVEAEQAEAKSGAASATAAARLQECRTHMQADLAAEDAKNAPLPKPQR